MTTANNAVEFGCGNGLVAQWMASTVESTGQVSAIDISPDQLATAKERAETAGIKNITYREGSAYASGLASSSFDLAYCRFLMCHLARPADALREMQPVVRPQGLIVCEDFDASLFERTPQPKVTRG
jgi:ubiquinone/menaquinone biosynthesis C-methylase UbiE